MTHLRPASEALKRAISDAQTRGPLRVPRAGERASSSWEESPGFMGSKSMVIDSGFGAGDGRWLEGEAFDFFNGKTKGSELLGHRPASGESRFDGDLVDGWFQVDRGIDEIIISGGKNALDQVIVRVGIDELSVAHAEAQIVSVDDQAFPPRKPIAMTMSPGLNPADDFAVALFEPHDFPSKFLGDFGHFGVHFLLENIGPVGGFCRFSGGLPELFFRLGNFREKGDRGSAHCFLNRCHFWVWF